MVNLPKVDAPDEEASVRSNAAFAIGKIKPDIAEIPELIKLL